MTIRLLFLLLLTCFARVSVADTPITLKVGGAGSFKLPDKNATDPKSRADRAIVDAFEKTHPNIHLASAQGLQIDGTAAESSLLMAFAGGTAPDVVYVNFRSTSTFVSQGFLLPLDDYLSRDPSVFARVKPNIQKVLLDAGHGHVYSLPYLQVVQALYYRKDMFQDAGLDPDKAPGNWDEFYDACKKIGDPAHGKYGFEFQNDDGDSAYYWINFLWSAGGDVVKKAANGRWVAAFNTPQGVQALEFYKKLMTAPWKGPDGKTYKGVAIHSSTMKQDQANGKVAMWFSYQSNVIANQADASALNPSLIGIAPMPKGPTGISGNEINAYMWGISSQIKDPRIKDAAWEFIKFMGSDEADRIRTTAYVEAGLGATVNPVSLQKYGFDDYTSRNSKAWLEANKTLFANGKPEPYGENMNQIYNLLGTPLGQIESNPNADPMTLLNASAREIDTKLTGYVPPQVQAQRRRTAWTIFGIVLTGVLALLGFQAQKWYKAREAARAAVLYASRPAGLTSKAQVIAWLFMIPAVGSILLWAYYPLGRGLVMAFQDYHIIGRSHFVGLDNFIDIFTQHSFQMGLINSFIFTIITLLFGFFLPIFLALGLSEIPRGKLFLRTVYYLPAVVAPITISLLWKQIESPGPDGLLNQVVHFLTLGHAPTVQWLQDPHWAMFAVILPRIWAAAGPGSIIYLAALKSIPDDMYEAADLDGAGVWTKITKITLPTLKPLILINLVGTTIAAFKVSEEIFVITGGGPLYATHTLGLEIFYNAFLYLRFGYATAAACIMGSLLIGFTMYQLRIMKDLRFSGAKA